jgi:hypothetical protein
LARLQKFQAFPEEISLSVPHVLAEISRLPATPGSAWARWRVS